MLTKQEKRVLRAMVYGAAAERRLRMTDDGLVDAVSVLVLKFSGVR